MTVTPSGLRKDLELHLHSVCSSTVATKGTMIPTASLKNDFLKAMHLVGAICCENTCQIKP